MDWRPSLCDVRRPLTCSSQELLGQCLQNLICSICRVRTHEIAKLMTPPPPPPGEVGFGGKKENLLKFPKTALGHGFHKKSKW